MRNCEQTKGMSVLEHGESVWKYYQDLISYMQTGNSDLEWRFPDWINDYKEQLLENQHDLETVEEYTVFHDCGKPFCREVDEDGRVHFPNHAEVSKQTYLDHTDNETVANLIGWDMAYHVFNAAQIEEHCKDVWDVKDVFTLLLVALSEVHSNASMFGGIESVSFKSKWKRLNRRGRAVCKMNFGG